MDNKLKQEAYELHLQGLSVREIGELLNIGKSTAHKYIHEMKGHKTHLNGMDELEEDNNSRKSMWDEGNLKKDELNKEVEENEGNDLKADSKPENFGFISSEESKRMFQELVDRGKNLPAKINRLPVRINKNNEIVQIEPEEESSGIGFWGTVAIVVGGFLILRKLMK